jgi:apolipoprotein N-acyltransferase
MCKGWPWLLAVLSGCLLVLCFAPFPWGDLCWVALTPLVAGVWFSRPSPRREWLRLAGLGYAMGVVFFGGSLVWLTTLTVPGWALLSLYLALYPAAWCVFLGTVIRPAGVDKEGRPVWLSSLANLKNCALGAAAWVTLEWLRGWVFTGFGWNSLGVALHKNIPIIQIADLAGVAGLSFLVVMANLMAVATVKRLILEVGRGARRPHYDFAITVAAVALAWTYGIRQLLAPPPESVEVTFAAVQANVPQDVRNDSAFEADVLDLYKKHTEHAIAMRPDLILWPESATPRPLFNDQTTWDTVSALAKTFDGDLLIGTVHFSEQGDYNSVALLSNKGQEAQMYHKMHLVPFGEFVPFRESFPLLAMILGDLVPGDFDRGPYPQILEMTSKPVRLAPLICFEDTLGYLARKFTLLGAQAFAVVTNDGWFLDSPGSRQHLQNAIFRCAENKIPMIRAANTGVTCWVDRFGVVRQVLSTPDGNTFIEGVLFNKLDVPASPEPSVFARYGEWFSFLCIGVTALATGIFLIRRRSLKDSACPQSPETKT